MTQLKYKPLKGPLTEIRMLELAPGRGRLQGRLRTHDLKEAEGTYVTLSHCWVERDHGLAITIDQCIFRIAKTMGCHMRLLLCS